MKKDLSNKIGYIYKITAPNGKVYIGQTMNVKNRRYNYGKNSFKLQVKLWNSCQKYKWSPKDNFEIIEECLCGENKVYLNEREQYWINYYDSFKNGLNCNEGGHGNIGHKHSEESKQKMSNSAKKYSEIRSLRLSKRMTGSKLSEKTKKKISTKLTGIKRDEDFRKKMSDIGKKRIMSECTKNKISKNKTGLISSRRKKICQLTLNGDLIKIWDYSGIAEKELEIPKGKISAVCLGNRKTTGGYKWKYLEE